jgi:hypothetical protein
MVKKANCFPHQGHYRRTVQDRRGITDKYHLQLRLSQRFS